MKEGLLLSMLNPSSISMTVDDVINEQDEMKAHTCEMVMWPRKWQSYPNRFTCNWQSKRLDPANTDSIPEGPGVYTLVVISEVAGHPHSSYLMYVGETRSLRRRFREYLGPERGPEGRPLIMRLLVRYGAYVWFFYTEANMADIKDLQNDLISAFIPPCNTKEIPARLLAARGAF